MLGVLVLVVVMAVYAGLERDVKSRLLGFTPHILLQHLGPGPAPAWQETAKTARNLPNIRSASAYVEDNVILDVNSQQSPVSFWGVDTSDANQVAGITKMLDLANHPASSSDLGIDDRVIISSVLLDNYQKSGVPLDVGDKLRLYSTRNFEGVMSAYKATERPPIRESYAESWTASTRTLAAAWKSKGEKFTLSAAAYREVYSTLETLRMESIRQPERDLIENILRAMDTSEGPTAEDTFIFSTAAKSDVEAAVASLQTTDPEKMDGDTLKGLKELVLPKEVTIIGVYQASQMTATPGLFLPLPLAQDLAGLGQAVQGIALRMEDPYQAEQVAAEAADSLGPDWSLLTWGQRYRDFFALINQQRVMMYFALSFIVLVSAFSMMAVMFTVTLQKRREIGVMKALGAAPNQIVRVFLYQGMILGVLGAILGVGLGRLVIYFRSPLQLIFRGLGFDPFAANFTGFTVLPAYNDPTEQVVIAFMAFVLCSLAALVPAFFAARSDAAKSLRNL
jgi:lipoprotein-releasing system permease protein